MLVYRHLRMTLPTLTRHLNCGGRRERCRRRGGGSRKGPSGSPFRQPKDLLLFFVRCTSLPLVHFMFLTYAEFAPGEVEGSATDMADTVTITLS